MNTQSRLTPFDLPQIQRFAVGFDQIFDNLWRNSHATSTAGNYPPYNILTHSDTNITIEIAVAGFTEKELDVQLCDGQLTISGIKSAEKDEAKPVYLHRGISNRDFTRTFNLSEIIEIRGATVENGLLRIQLEKVIPEEAKSKKIPITYVK